MNLTPSDIKALEQSIYKDSYFEFFKAFWHTISGEELKLNWHIKYIADELQAVGQRVINREAKEYDLIINVPPGSSKSTLATVLFPAWLWINDPSLKIISGSFSGALSIEHATLSKDCILSDKFQDLFGDTVEIRKDINNKQEYRTTVGGMRKTTSSGASITGSHAHLLICDDPIDPKGVKSDAILQTVTNWFDRTLPTRKVDKENTPTILIMQRLHQDDPTGNWLRKAEQGKAIKHICLPSSDEFPIYPESVKAYYKNGLMDSNRMKSGILDQIKIDLGSMEYAGQFGQQPRAAEGNIIKAEYLPIIPHAQIPRLAFNQVVDFAADTAFTENKQNDPSACIAYIEFRGYLFILDYLNIRAEFPKLVKQLTNFVAINGKPNSKLYIEPKASGQSVVQYLKAHTRINTIEYDLPKGDKIARLNSVIPFLESKRVVLVEGSWNESFISECLIFPNGKHDEAVDVLTMAATNKLLRKRKGGYSYSI